MDRRRTTKSFDKSRECAVIIATARRLEQCALPLEGDGRSMSEQLIPLSDEDRQVLTKSRTTGVRLTFAMTIAAVLLLAVLIVFHTLIFVIVLGVVSLALLTTAALAFLNFRSVSKDLSGGQKQMISGPVEAQNVEVTRTTDDD